MLCLLTVLSISIVAINGDGDIEDLKKEVSLLKSEVSRLDMLIKFYNPEWTWTPARDCGISCPYMVNLLDFAGVQWRFNGYFNGVFDLEFVNEKGRMHGNMDFYERHMWMRHCGWVAYDVEAPRPEGLRTWTFAKRSDGFKLYAEDTLLLDYTYEEGECADTWSGANVGFFFETPVDALHLLQHGMDMLWWQKA